MPRVGLIAGNGRFPILFARGAQAAGYEVIAVAHQGETEPELDAVVAAVTWVKVGELEPMISAFRDAGVAQAVMAGGIRKAALLEHFAPDARGLAFIARLIHLGDDALLRGLADELESEGIRIVSSTLFLESLLAPAGTLTQQPPTEAQWRDIRHGVAVARAIGRWDIGQSVVVKTGIVLAVEAIEGTDATIQRGGSPGAVVVKVSKPQQDLRFDVPAIGPETVRVCATAGIAVLAVEAGKTLVLEREAVLRQAAATGLCIVGVDAGGAPAETV